MNKILDENMYLNQKHTECSWKYQEQKEKVHKTNLEKQFYEGEY